ncbi:hypothetical protein D9758_002464 [Tetrapyrgos nigripes]|uniref:Uncharacterized protein n=1 Tax=Tetrapyrgos nigripes TaxID=182062 RepID=A0A8H5GP00_9AGAR|nr:hypothetical protein D9758_002464 [Tetrapyrgos nigripes]
MTLSDCGSMTPADMAMWGGSDEITEEERAPPLAYEVDTLDSGGSVSVIAVVGSDDGGIEDEQLCVLSIYVFSLSVLATL